jgi:hypothetical protein
LRADLERLQLEQAEPHLQHRQSVYHDFLDSGDRFFQDRVGTEEFEVDELRAWFRDHEHRLSAVRLFGTEEASRAAQDLADVMGDMMEHEKLPQELENRYLELWEAAIQAMRKDTAPKASS